MITVRCSGTRLAQPLLDQRARDFREPFPYHPADNGVGRNAPEFQRASIGIDDAPFAIDRVERVAHAFKDCTGVIQARNRFGINHGLHGPGSGYVFIPNAA
jgi:hypothetical protein